MGYNLHITRGEWLSDHADKLKFKEWIFVAARDPELIPDNDNAVQAQRLALEGDDVAPLEERSADFVWRNAKAMDDFTFRYFKHSVRVKGAAGHVEVVQKMLEIAERLGAQVQGDEDEYYRIVNGEIVTFREGGSR